MRASKFGLASALSAFALVVTAASASHAATYSLVADYGSATPSGVFTYGTGVGASQTQFTTNYPSCFGNANFECTNSQSNADVPGVGKDTNTDNTPQGLVGTVSVPTDVLWMHPGNGTSQPDNVSVVFTAPTTGAYDFTGFFERLSTVDGAAGAGVNNGVNLTGYINDTEIATAFLDPGAYGNSLPFSDILHLTANDKVTLLVDNAKGYEFDSTGLNLTVTSAAPEPASWALMILGIGGMGAVLRRSRRRAGLAATA